MWVLHWTEVVSFLLCALIVGAIFYGFWRVPISHEEKGLEEKKLGWHLAAALTVVLLVGFLCAGSPALRKFAQFPWQLMPVKGLDAPIPGTNFEVSESGELKLLTDPPKGQLWVIDPQTGRPFFAQKGQSFELTNTWTVNFQDVETGEVSPAIPVHPSS